MPSSNVNRNKTADSTSSLLFLVGSVDFKMICWIRYRDNTKKLGFHSPPKCLYRSIAYSLSMSGSEICSVK